MDDYQRKAADVLTWKMTQIIPAQGWFAAAGAPRDPELYPLAAWALCVDREGVDFVTGLLAEPNNKTGLCVFAATLEDFIGYQQQ